jgi:hypothetical protein
MGHVAYCEHSKNPVFDQAVYGADPALRQQARRGWVLWKPSIGTDGQMDADGPYCVDCRVLLQQNMVLPESY